VAIICLFIIVTGAIYDFYQRSINKYFHLVNLAFYPYDE